MAAHFNSLFIRGGVNAAPPPTRTKLFAPNEIQTIYGNATTRIVAQHMRRKYGLALALAIHVLNPEETRFLSFQVTGNCLEARANSEIFILQDARSVDQSIPICRSVPTPTY
jgi:hypothetical protein